MRLYWTPSRDLSGAKTNEKYLPQTETIALPELFWSDPKQILGLLTQTRLSELTFDQPGQFVADRLTPLITQVRALVESKEGVWNSETLAGVWYSLAVALAVYGEQSGKNEPFAESIELYRKVLDEWTRERVPLKWAITQNNLGNALGTLGERESGTDTLTKAVNAYREALKELTRERAPFGWAATQGGLATALALLGEQESDPVKLEEAVTAFREVLKEYTHERVPLHWAKTQNNLGNALQRLGEKLSVTARFEEAVSAYHEALKERTRTARLGQDSE
jgi:tetratricopeptide (TPR) repeat protein